MSKEVAYFVLYKMQTCGARFKVTGAAAAAAAQTMTPSTLTQAVIGEESHKPPLPHLQPQVVDGDKTLFSKNIKPTMMPDDNMYNVSSELCENCINDNDESTLVCEVPTVIEEENNEKEA